MMTAVHAAEGGDQDARAWPERDLDEPFVTFTVEFARELAALRTFLNVAPIGVDELSGWFERFSRWMAPRMSELHCHAERLGAVGAIMHAEYFRYRMRPFTEDAVFLKRANDRPRGYAGDSGMMRMLYDRDFVGATTFGKLLHRHPIESAAACAVRARLGFIADLIARRRSETTGTLRVLSVACGPAREVRHHLASRADAERTELVFVDQDAEALLEVGEELQATEARLGVTLSARREKISVRDLLKDSTVAERLGTFDVIYTMGLFDYLDAKVASRLTEILFAMTREGGTVAIGNFHVATDTRAYLDYWMNWPLIYRDEDAMRGLARGVQDAAVRVEFEETRSQMFLVLDRRGSDAGSIRATR